MLRILMEVTKISIWVYVILAFIITHVLGISIWLMFDWLMSGLILVSSLLYGGMSYLCCSIVDNVLSEGMSRLADGADPQLGIGEIAIAPLAPLALIIGGAVVILGLVVAVGLMFCFSSPVQKQRTI